MESVPLKKSWEAGLDRKGETRPKDPNKLESSVEIAMRKAERMLAEAESKKQDLEKIKEIEKNFGLKLKDTEETIQDQIKELEKAKIEDVEVADDYWEFTKEELGGETPKDSTEQEKTKLEDVEKADAYQEFSSEALGAEESKTIKKEEPKTKSEEPNNIIEFSEKKKEKETKEEKEGNYESSSSAERAKVQAEALEDFKRGLKKDGWIKKVFKKKETGESREAKKIDRLMRGDTRSDEAVKIDELMGKEGKKETPKSDFQQLLEKVDTFNDLIDVFNQIGTVEGQTKEDRQKIVHLMFRNKDKRYLNFIPEKFGMRENAERVYDLMRKKIEEHGKNAG